MRRQTCPLGTQAAPIVLTRWSVVMDTQNFIKATLAQLEAALCNKNWLAGNWSVQELVDRLEQVGVQVRLAIWIDRV